MLPILATGLTWLRAFKGPCLALSLAGLLAGSAAGGWLAWKIQAGRVARAEAALAGLRADIAEQTAALRADAARRQAEADAKLRERDQAVTAAVDSIPAEVAKLLRPQYAELRGLVNEARYDCLRDPLPDAYLERLRRPAGSAAPNR